MKPAYGMLPCEVWLHLYREGGYSTSTELKRSVMTDAEPTSISRALRNLASAGMVARRGQTYGVTPGCKIPVGVTLKDVLS